MDSASIDSSLSSRVCLDRNTTRCEGIENYILEHRYRSTASVHSICSSLLSTLPPTRIHCSQKLPPPRRLTRHLHSPTPSTHNSSHTILTAVASTWPPTAKLQLPFHTTIFHRAGSQSRIKQTFPSPLRRTWPWQFRVRYHQRRQNA